jgi:hypothetical protein
MFLSLCKCIFLVLNCQLHLIHARPSCLGSIRIFFSHFSDVDEVAIIHKAVSPNLCTNKIEKFLKLSILHMFCNMLKLNRVIWRHFKIWSLENQRNTFFSQFEKENNQFSHTKTSGSPFLFPCRT